MGACFSKSFMRKAEVRDSRRRSRAYTKVVRQGLLFEGQEQSQNPDEIFEQRLLREMASLSGHYPLEMSSVKLLMQELKRFLFLSAEAVKNPKKRKRLNIFVT